ncbi:hypothetical protein DSO57_1005865 [Entomophthora muscae]|uniref:Uncharacterized protein n=1 Tax=Entomophthora muscae TaxID=34485 RepID=A0ACC2USQ9_9FUNG|nr:hypothetical protein DSO57_1005865 [Entomophthora muscae]
MRLSPIPIIAFTLNLGFVVSERSGTASDTHWKNLDRRSPSYAVREIPKDALVDDSGRQYNSYPVREIPIHASRYLSGTSPTREVSRERLSWRKDPKGKVTGRNQPNAGVNQHNMRSYRLGSPPSYTGSSLPAPSQNLRSLDPPSDSSTACPFAPTLSYDACNVFNYLF